MPMFLLSDSQKPAKLLNAGRAQVEAQCKEEQEHVPIIKIKSVCSMAHSNPPPKTQVIVRNQCHLQ